MIIDRQFATSDSVVFAELDGEAVLLNVQTGVYFGLDAIGTRIWTLLQEGSSLEHLVHALSSEYDVEPGQLNVDIADFLAALQSNGLVRTVHA